MCTAFSHSAGDHYFGRNLDLDHHYQEEITITPREYHFPYRHVSPLDHHYAMIGIATIVDDYPLYYDAANEYGLCMAALNFPGNAIFTPFDPKKTNIPSFELIPWVLAQCKSVDEAEKLMVNINLCDTAFREHMPPTPLHWILSDRHRSIVIEPTKNGMQIINNPVGVLTNNPPFSFHLHNLSNYMNLTPLQPINRFSPGLNLKPYSLGMGAIGLPGDFSSSSRFIRCSFIKENSHWGDTENARVSQAFHILDSVAQFDGCVETQLGHEKTLYSICCNATKGVFYYTTYQNRQITAVDMQKENLNQNKLITFPMVTEQKILQQN